MGALTWVAIVEFTFLALFAERIKPVRRWRRQGVRLFALVVFLPGHAVMAAFGGLLFALSWLCEVWQFFLAECPLEEVPE